MLLLKCTAVGALASDGGYRVLHLAIRIVDAFLLRVALILAESKKLGARLILAGVSLAG